LSLKYLRYISQKYYICRYMMLMLFNYICLKNISVKW